MTSRCQGKDDTPVATDDGGSSSSSSSSSSSRKRHHHATAAGRRFAAILLLAPLVLASLVFLDGRTNLGCSRISRLRLREGAGEGNFTQSNVVAPRVVRVDMCAEKEGGDDCIEQPAREAARNRTVNELALCWGREDDCLVLRGRGDDAYMRPKQQFDHDDCQPIGKWQTASFITCNSIHEIDGIDIHRNKKLGHSGFKSALRITEGVTDGEGERREVVYRTLKRPDRFGSTEDLHRMIEKGRVEALGTERLTSSSGSVDLYAYCGFSFVSEIASMTLQEFLNDESNAKTLEYSDKLQMSVEVAQMVSDLHSIDYPRGTRPSMAHLDFQPRNVMIAKTSNTHAPRLTMIDFGGSIPLYESPTKQRANVDKGICRATGYTRMGKHSAKPPELFNATGYQDGQRPIDLEKIDIFQMGATMYQILMGRINYIIFGFDMSFAPRDEERKYFPMERVLPLHPSLASLLDGHQEEPDTAVAAMLYAVLACLTFEPSQRPTAYRVAEGLRKAQKWVRQGKTNTPFGEIKALFQDDPRMFARTRPWESDIGDYL